MAQNLKAAIEAICKRTGIELKGTDLDQMTELEHLEITTRLMEFAKNVEMTQYYAHLNQTIRLANEQNTKINGEKSL